LLHYLVKYKFSKITMKMAFGVQKLIISMKCGKIGPRLPLSTEDQ